MCRAWGLIGKMRFRAAFNEVLVVGAPDAGCRAACHRLADAGCELVCVSALEQRFEAARLRNPRALGYPIERVIATRASHDLDAAPRPLPQVFVDDYPPI